MTYYLTRQSCVEYCIQVLSGAVQRSAVALHEFNLPGFSQPLHGQRTIVIVLARRGRLHSFAFSPATPE